MVAVMEQLQRGNLIVTVEAAQVERMQANGWELVNKPEPAKKKPAAKKTAAAKK